MRSFASRFRSPALLILAALVLIGLLAAACAPAGGVIVAGPSPFPPRPITLIADGETRSLQTSGATVAEALAEAGLTVEPADEVDPPPATSLRGSETAEPLTITVVRVTETTETIPESIPFARRVVRSAEMSPGDPSRLLQTGAAGLQEVTVRIVYRDGLEVERWPTAVTVIDPPVDEIVMVGVGSDRDAMHIAGRLAYLNDGRAILLEDSTDAPRQLAISGRPDGRVFQLSPNGEYLAYTIAPDGGDLSSFRNELWVIPTAEGGQPVTLNIENVLWAGWDPAGVETPRLAYTTARSVALPPGWEANNDLWLLELPANGTQPAPVRLIESYPADYGWWGGNYSWSPDGSRLAYAFAGEVGALDMPGALAADGAAGFIAPPEPARAVLHGFTPLDTGADWAWVPALGWSADGRYLAFTAYEAEAERFDLWLADTASADTFKTAEDTGIWSALAWSPNGQLASLRATDPAAGEDSGYALWLGDGRGEAGRVYPPEDESGGFARASQALTWGPGGAQLAFIFEDALHVLDPATNEVIAVGLDDTISSHPTWAPYGAAGSPQ